MILYLLASIISSTIILWLFRIFAQYKIDLLQAVVANYMVASSLGWILFRDGSADAGPWIYPALFLGFLFIFLFLLMGRSTQLFGMGLTSVVVKMSVAIPILAGIILYKDELGWLKMMGIFIALLGIYLITPAGQRDHRGSAWMLLALFLGSGLLDTFLKWSEHHYVSDGNEPQFSSTIFGFAALFGFIYFLTRREKNFEWRSWLWGWLLGVPNFFSIYFLVRLLAWEGMESSWIFPVNNMGIVILSTLMGILIYKESMTLRMRIGFLLSLISILFLGFSL